MAVFAATLAIPCAAAPALAATIQIGTFGWEDISADAFLFCNNDEPCARFTVTNDLHLLGAGDLAALNLTGTESFVNARVAGTCGAACDLLLGNIGAGASGDGPIFWPSASATLTFTLPAFVGTLFIPTLGGPTLDGPAAITINVDTNPAPIPEPGTMTLLGVGLGAAWARRQAARRRARTPPASR